MPMRKSLTVVSTLVVFGALLIGSRGAMVSADANTPAAATPSPSEAGLSSLALVNGTLIDGTGAEPVRDAALVIRAGRIVAVGSRAAIAIPADAKLIDVQGGTILPGFINAHVHNAFSASNLETWARAGVTTVRDEGVLLGNVVSLLAWRDKIVKQSQYARLVSAGSMITVPGGYGNAFVSSPDEARQLVSRFLDGGAELIKISEEDGYAGRHDLPKLSKEELAAIVVAAHERGVPVSAHVTAVKYLQMVLDAGVDDAAHMVCDRLSADLIRRMVAADMYVIPTLTVLEAYGCLGGSSINLRDFAAAGGKVALGNDYTDIPQNGFDHFELGMPMHEIERMARAGLTARQIIVAATKNAAHVCNLDKELGTLEAGKLADVLVLNGDPLQDLNALTKVRLVIHAGVVIRDESR
jgi:imidazolonepropionase-like amidohydrolase